MRTALFIIIAITAIHTSVASELRIKTPQRPDEIVLELDQETGITFESSGVSVEVREQDLQRFLRGLDSSSDSGAGALDGDPTPTFRGFDIEPFEAASAAAPRLQTTRMLQTIRPRKTDAIRQSDIENFTVRRDQIDPGFQSEIAFDANDRAEVPLFARNSVVIKLASDLTPDQLDALLDEYDFELISVQAQLGTIHVRADLSGFMPAPSIEDPDPRFRSLRGLAAAAEHYSKDARIEAAAPDLIMRPQQLASPTNIVSNLVSEKTDWGIDDIQAPTLWSMERARDGAVIGILDAGFGRHEDLVFSQMPLEIAAGNHGTHVSGIACARHDNGAGLRGVLPNCFVVPKADPIGQTVDQDVLDYMNLFSDVIADLNRIITAIDGVRVFNVSLGYNWRSNFGINPEDPKYQYIRDIVRMHGRILISVLENARDQDKVIYSAAGNDSDGNTDRRTARYASAFNWAAIEARSTGIATNGIVVQAHDSSGGRAAFSNEDGNISCPGVDVLSTLARDANNQPSVNSYGEMSGTSMAAPYCAAGHVLFSLIRPRYSNIEIADCLIQAGEDLGTGAPHLRLSDALARCPTKGP